MNEPGKPPYPAREHVARKLELRDGVTSLDRRAPLP